MLKSLLPLSLKTVRRDEVVNLERAGWISGSAFVVPRAECRFERIWTPRADKKGVDAVKLSIEQTSQPMEPGIFVEPMSETDSAFLNCWVWDNNSITQAIGRNSLLIPEPMARIPADSGVRLVHCLYGLEGQIWESGRLIASRWWRSEPTEIDWLQFIEGSEVTIGAFTEDLEHVRNLPEAEQVDWRTDVSLADFGTSAIETTISPVRAFAIAALVLSMPFCYLAGSGLKLNREISSAQSKLEALQLELSDVADARRIAIANRAEIEAYRAGGDPFRMINVLEEFGLAANPSEVTVRQLSYNGSSIELRFVADARMLLPDLIRKLELSPHWDAASATTNTNGEIVLRGQLAAFGGVS